VVHEEALHAARQRFEQRAGHLTTDLRNELAACQSVLRGASGLLATAPPLTEDAWRNYVTRLDLEDTLPPVRTLGYADVAPRSMARLAAGSDATARLAAPADKVAPIVLMAPQPPDAPLLGYDIGNDADRRAAMLFAADSGEIGLNLRAAPFNATATDIGPRLELYLPVYSTPVIPPTPETRLANVTGMLLAVLDTTRLFETLMVHARHVDLQIFAGAPQTPLYTSADPADEKTSDQPPLASKTDTLRFGGTTLTLVYTASERDLGIDDDYASATVLTAGIAAAALLAGLAFAMARERTGTAGETREAHTQSTLNEARMMGIIRSSMEAIITIDENQRIVIFNPMAEQLFGCSAMEAVGASLSRFIPERFRAAHGRHVEQFGVTGVSDRQMGKQRVLFGLRANGEEFPIEASISQIRDGTGKLYTVMLRDVTERVKADNAQRKSRQELRELSANLQNVREEEKTRIARELHDDLGQQLTALKMDLSSVEQALEVGSGPATQLVRQLRGMRRLIDATVASARRIAADLRPVMLDDLGLIPAIEWLVNDFTNRYGIEVERRLEVGDTEFTRNGATTLFRIVQEALTNVARHAEATCVRLTMRVADRQCELHIADNGHGAQQHGARTDKPFGLLGIRERAHMLGGTVEINSENGKGFAITVTLPLQAVRQEEAQT
jgi:two-component system sensor histidine kinase UhpB